MKINWSARFKNPVWWAEVAASIVLPMLAAIGLSWEDMTTWGALLDAVKTAIANPVVVVAMVVSVILGLIIAGIDFLLKMGLANIIG